MTDRNDPPDGFDRDDELRALLAAADPAHALAPADPAGLAALLEDTMSHDIQPRTQPEVGARATGTDHRNPLTWLVAAAAVLVIAGVGAFGLSRMSDDGPVVEAGDAPTATESTGSTVAAPAVTQLGAPPPVEARCAVPTPEMLAAQELAFAGTVTAIEGDTVTLSTTAVYAGDVAEQVQVTAPSAEMYSLLAAVQFEVGGDYLVSANDGVVSLCSFSGPATPALQRLYDRAFPG